MSLPIPYSLSDLSNEDVLDIAWEPEFLEQATPLECLLLERLGEQCQALALANEAYQRLLACCWQLR